MSNLSTCFAVCLCCALMSDKFSERSGYSFLLDRVAPRVLDLSSDQVERIREVFSKADVNISALHEEKADRATIKEAESMCVAQIESMLTESQRARLDDIVLMIVVLPESMRIARNPLFRGELGLGEAEQEAIDRLLEEWFDQLSSNEDLKTTRIDSGQLSFRALEPVALQLAPTMRSKVLNCLNEGQQKRLGELEWQCYFSTNGIGGLLERKLMLHFRFSSDQIALITDDPSAAENRGVASTKTEDRRRRLLALLRSFDQRQWAELFERTGALSGSVKWPDGIQNEIEKKFREFHFVD